MRVPYIRFWLNDFYDATAHLPRDVRHSYRDTIDAAWLTGQASLPNDDSAIRRMIGISPWKWGAQRAQVMAFWFLAEDGRWHNKRLDHEWRKATDRVYRDALTKEKLRSNKFLIDPNENSPANSTRARAAAPEAGKISALQQRDLPAVETEVQPPAPLRVRPHAPQAAPNGETHVIFLRQGSPEWAAYEAEHGPLSAHSMHDGEPGRWMKP